MTKFDWIKRLGRDGRLSYSDRYILTMTALRSASSADLTFCVRQSSIAQNCSASERTVRRALDAGRRHGYIELVELRRRGRGNHGGDRYRLTSPEIPATRAGNPDLKYRPPAPKIPATRAENTGQTRAADQHELPPPLGLKEVFRWSGGRAGCAAADLPSTPPLRTKPNPHCPRHPHGTSQPCRDCGAARKDTEQWTAEHDARQRLISQTLRAAVDSCNACDEHAWQLDSPPGCATKCPNIKEYQ